MSVGDFERFKNEIVEAVTNEGSDAVVTTITTSDGAPITGQSLEAGGSGTFGWLSSIRKAITDRLPSSLGQKIQSLSLSVVQSVDVAAFAYEQVTVAATSTALTSGTYSTATKAVLRLETAQIRYRIDGVAAPTASVGTLLEIGEVLELNTAAEIAAFRAIRTGGTSGLLSCTYSKAS